MINDLKKILKSKKYFYSFIIITILIIISCSNPNQSKVLIGKMNNGEEVFGKIPCLGNDFRVLVAVSDMRERCPSSSP